MQVTWFYISFIQFAMEKYSREMVQDKQKERKLHWVVRQNSITAWCSLNTGHSSNLLLVPLTDFFVVDVLFFLIATAKAVKLGYDLHTINSTCFKHTIQWFFLSIYKTTQSNNSNSVFENFHHSAKIPFVHFFDFLARSLVFEPLLFILMSYMISSGVYS